MSYYTINCTVSESECTIFEEMYVDKLYMSHIMTKLTKWHVHPAKTQICLGIRPYWSEASLSPWRKFWSLATQRAHSDDSDQTGQMPRLIWVFTGHTCHFVITRHTRSGGVLCYTLRKFWVSVHPSICLSVRPSISPSFPASNLSSFWLIFFKLCMDIDIGEVWLGIANGLNLNINNRVIALDWL